MSDVERTILNIAKKEKKITKDEHRKLDRTRNWLKKAKQLLKGKRITNVGWSYWNETKYRDEWGDETGFWIEFDNDMFLFLSSDDEGNSPGAAFLQWDKNETVKDWDSNKKNRNYSIPVGVMPSHEYYNKLNKLKEVKNGNK